MSNKKDFSHLRLDGGNLSLDFINTISDRFEDPLYDHLSSYPELVIWAAYAGGIDENLKERFLTLAGNEPAKADRVFEQARQLREAMCHFIEGLIDGDAAPTADVGLINEWLGSAYSRLELNQAGDEIRLDWDPKAFGQEGVVWPIVRSFVELVTSEERSRIKQCPNCGWVFIDQSKNSSRRWCSMETCGNRVKVQRHARKKLG